MIRKFVTRGVLAAALAGVAAPAFAEDIPNPTQHDPRIREAVYNEAQVFEIPGVFRIATEIRFSDGEVVEHVALGDSVSWEVAPAASSLFVKPRERAGATNLTVITRSRYGPRTYRFALTPTHRGTGFFTVIFRYPEQEAAERRAMEASAQLAALEAAERGLVKSALDIGVLEGTRNTNYVVQGSTAIQPSEVSDNGQFTVMRFPNQRELPAFFVVNPDGSEGVASFDVRDEYVVLHGVYRTIRLRRGLEVLCIHNQSPDYYGRDPKTDTASELVERTTATE
ncbi:P-type conjugative transfer protein VirB9 [Erythrobacter westpacificensis]|jgi:type IV secretion system protein VirB9|uniref:P-type conjugative transfer protein VirB9 n=1 Tax=Erythrobacter westpacificensis TaxID=1055231 RepID=A0ABP9KTZ3_9SPHN